MMKTNRRCLQVTPNAKLVARDASMSQSKPGHSRSHHRTGMQRMHAKWHAHRQQDRQALTGSIRARIFDNLVEGGVAAHDELLASLWDHGTHLAQRSRRVPQSNQLRVRGQEAQAARTRIVRPARASEPRARTDMMPSSVLARAGPETHRPYAVARPVSTAYSRLRTASANSSAQGRARERERAAFAASSRAALTRHRAAHRRSSRPSRPAVPPHAPPTRPRRTRPPPRPRRVPPALRSSESRSNHLRARPP